MAASGSTSRAVYAGLSCGFVFAVPVAAYVATMPFPDANSSVTSLALPFTMGALAGVGILSAVSAVGRRHAITEEDDAEDSSPSASPFSSTAFEQRELRVVGAGIAPVVIPAHAFVERRYVVAGQLQASADAAFRAAGLFVGVRKREVFGVGYAAGGGAVGFIVGASAERDGGNCQKCTDFEFHVRL